MAVLNLFLFGTGVWVVFQGKIACCFRRSSHSKGKNQSIKMFTVF